MMFLAALVKSTAKGPLFLVRCHVRYPVFANCALLFLFDANAAIYHMCWE
jgi:hypothetical protein